MEEQIPDKNLFMMCGKLENNAINELPKGFYVRYCKKNELDTFANHHAHRGSYPIFEAINVRFSCEKLFNL